MKISSAEILAAKAGEPEARAALMAKVALIADGMLRRLRKASRDRRQMDWAALHQDVLVQVIRLLPRLRGTDGGQLVAWIWRIANSRHQDARRRPGVPGSKEAPMLPLDAVLDRLDLTDSGLAPLEAASAAERCAVVARALAELPPRFRRVIELRMADGHSFEVVAEFLGLPSANAAECCFRRALARVEAILLEARAREDERRAESE
ncbi:MAG: hypothetical protein IT457_20560 [Planctomycetes bacterium]|nr:hypothetical protein [Planctomycetota bacterium]